MTREQFIALLRQPLGVVGLVSIGVLLIGAIVRTAPSEPRCQRSCW